jgi:WD40 repeat protein
LESGRGMRNEELAMRKGELGVMRIRWLVLVFIFGGVCWNIAAQSVEVYPQLGHSDSVSFASFSPDGKKILTSSNNDSKLWDVETGRLIKTFFGRSGIISPNGNQIITINGNNIKLWDVITHQEIRNFIGHTEDIYDVSFTPDGRQVLSISSDGIKVWDIVTGREIRTISISIRYGNRASFNSNGRQIISYSVAYGVNEPLTLWDIATGQVIRTFGANISSAMISPDGRQVLTSSGDGTLKIWDVNTGREIRTFTGKDGIFSPDGRQILLCIDNIMKLYDIDSGREIKTFTGHSRVEVSSDISIIFSMAFSQDGRKILSSAYDKTTKAWDVATGREIRTFTGCNYHLFRNPSFSPDGKQVLSSIIDDENNIKLWDLDTGREVIEFLGAVSLVNVIALRNNGNVLTGSSSRINLWDIATGKINNTYTGSFESEFNMIGGVSFSSDGTKAVSGTKVWEIETGRIIRDFTQQVTRDFSVDYGYDVGYTIFTPDGKQVLFRTPYGGPFMQGPPSIWDIETGREIRAFQEYAGRYKSGEFSHDGRQLVFVANIDRNNYSYTNESLVIMDVVTGREIKTIIGHPAFIYSVTLNNATSQVIVGYANGNIKLWDTATGREIRNFIGHTAEINSIALSPDEKQIISCSGDGTIRLWDITSGREIRTFSGNTRSAFILLFTRDGNRVISFSGDDRAVRIWDIATGREISQFISFIDGEWIALTPDGYYNTSPNGDRYLNVKLGNNIYGIDQYRSTFYRPQIVEARLQGRPDPVRVTTTIQDAHSFAPPVVTINRPQNGQTFTTNQTELSVTVTDQRQPIRNIKVLVNGRLVGGDSMRGIRGVRGGDLEATGIRLTDNQNRVEFQLNITLDPGKNIIEVIAFNGYSEGRASVEVTYRQATAQQSNLPNLWILAIGINRYNAQQLPNLNYAVADATAIINAFKTQEGKRYGRVNSRLVADGTQITPTRNNIIDSFDYFRQAGPQDVVLLFIAGHGVNDQDGNFYFMPSDATFNTDGTIQRSRAISFRDIQSVLDMPGQKLVFIDACHSAGTSSGVTRRVDNDRLVNDLNSNASIRSSSVIFTSSRGNESSLEYRQYGHGIFTYAILQGLRDEASAYNGAITMTALELYVRRKIPELTYNQQHPTISRPDGYDDFEVVRLR